MRAFARWLGWVLAAGLLLQIYFVGRIALMTVVDPQSTAFERSEIFRIATTKDSLRWRQTWVDYSQISDNLKRAVIASEDDGFATHDGVDWDALEKAWQKNAKAQAIAEARAQKQEQAQALAAKRNGNGNAATKPAPLIKTPKVIGGSTITQQLAKNLFLSGERTLLRKAQEIVLTFMLEKLLSKQRILEIYLNSVEWGEGIFGAEAAAQAYFRKPASRLSAYEAARLAVMLPRPKFFEKTPGSGYLADRAGTIAARMGGAELP